MNSLKNKLCSTDFSLCLLLCLIFCPLLVFSQTLRTTGNVQIKATGCVNIFVNGAAKFDSATVLKGVANFQVSEGTNRNFPEPCKSVISEKNTPCMTLFPNPVDDILTVQNWDINIENKHITYDIFDLQGRRMQNYSTQKVTDQLWQINVSHLPQGVYLLRYGECVDKFVKQ